MTDVASQHSEITASQGLYCLALLSAPLCFRTARACLSFSCSARIVRCMSNLGLPPIPRIQDAKAGVRERKVHVNYRIRTLR